MSFSHGEEEREKLPPISHLPPTFAVLYQLSNSLPYPYFCSGEQHPGKQKTVEEGISSLPFLTFFKHPELAVRGYDSLCCGGGGGFCSSVSLYLYYGFPRISARGQQRKVRHRSRLTGQRSPSELHYSVGTDRGGKTSEYQ